MTQALTDSPARRRRSVRQPVTQSVPLTPKRLAFLETVAEFREVTLPQLATRVGCSPKSARQAMRALFDSGLVDCLPLPRWVLAEPVDQADWLYGSGPNLYQITRAGLEVLHAVGLAEDVEPPDRRHRQPNLLLLRHLLLLRDVRLWVEQSARRYPGHRLELWKEEGEAQIDLHRVLPPTQLRPDARFHYRLGGMVLVAFLEVDRGTERGSRRWKEKVSAYEALFQGGLLREATGFSKARLLVVTSETRRRDHLAAFLVSSPVLAERCWLAGRSILETGDIHQPGWRRPADPTLRPLLSSELSRALAEQEE